MTRDVRPHFVSIKFIKLLNFENFHIHLNKILIMYVWPKFDLIFFPFSLVFVENSCSVILTIVDIASKLFALIRQPYDCCNCSWK